MLEVYNEKYSRNNRRQHPRFKIPEDMFVLIKASNALIMGEIINISKNGIAIEANAFEDTEDIKLDLAYLKRNFSLSDVKVEKVSSKIVDFKLRETDMIYHQRERFYMKFAHLSDYQRNKLNDFLDEFVMDTFDLRMYS